MVYGRIVLKEGWVVITKNGQAINFYADCGDEDCDEQWQWVDTIFQAIVTEYGVNYESIDKTFYCRTINSID